MSNDEALAKSYAPNGGYVGMTRKKGGDFTPQFFTRSEFEADNWFNSQEGHARIYRVRQKEVLVVSHK